MAKEMATDRRIFFMKMAEAREELQIAQKDFSKLEATHFKAGYREGLTAGKESSLQSGFAVGFAEAAECAMQWGVIRGKVMALQNYCESRGLLVPEKLPTLLKDIEKAEEGWKTNSLSHQLEQYRGSMEITPVTDGKRQVGSILSESTSPPSVTEFERRLAEVKSELGLQ